MSNPTLATITGSQGTGQLRKDLFVFESYSLRACLAVWGIWHTGEVWLQSFLPERIYLKATWIATLFGRSDFNGFFIYNTLPTNCILNIAIKFILDSSLSTSLSYFKRLLQKCCNISFGIHCYRQIDMLDAKNLTCVMTVAKGGGA